MSHPEASNAHHGALRKRAGINFRPHDFALLLPAMSEQDLEKLIADIKKNGLLDEIVLLDGKILDGVQRDTACKRAGVEPRYVNWDDFPEAIKQIGPLAYVYAKNIPRRHLTTEQRTEAALKLLPLLQEEARQRQLAGVSVNEAKGKAAELAAKAVGVSTSTVERALRVQQDDKPATEQPPESDLVDEVFTLLRKAKASIREFPVDVAVETVERLVKAVDIVRGAIYKLRAPAKADLLTDDSICPFGRHKGEPMRKVPDDWLRWWLSQNPDREAIEAKVDTFDHRERAIALRALRLWNYIAERFQSRDGVTQGENNNAAPAQQQ
jgi:ParB-like chromosome segregation protein Spo0J